jgi:DNA repair exonuclease SbcCD ATPase subunit
MKLLHLADIHILGLHRHGEHREAFNVIVDDAIKHGADHIFIGGDVWHTKTVGISPEYIDLLSNALIELSTVAQVHIILGNHDFNVTNKNRQDAVSPIVNALGNLRINLYKNSGVYEIERGVNLCVFSLYDEERWSAVKPVPGYYNIACYHGPVQGAVTDVNWHVDGDVSVSMFEDYDIVMLGDIHKHQFLGYRDYVTREGKSVSRPWIGYSGALLQNNYGESTNKGYLLWDIDTGSKLHDVKFVSIPQKHPFVTLEWKGDVQSIVSSSLAYPLGSRFRISSDVTFTHSDADALQRSLQLERSPLEVTFKVDAKRGDIDTIKIDGTSMHRNDVRNFDVLFNLLKEHCAGASLNDEELVRMEAVLRTYVNAPQASDDVLRGVRWSIEDFEFNNILAYGEDNYVKFSNLDGLVGLFGPNKVGKSSFIGALLYAIFNTSDRGSLKAQNIINERSDNCYASVTLNVDGRRYIIERQSVKHRGKKGVHATTALNVFDVDGDGERFDLNAEQRADTEKVIRRMLGTMDDFSLLNVSVQDGMKGFVNEGPTARKALVSRILDIDYFDRLHELAKDDVNSMKATVKASAKRSWQSEIDGVNENLRLNALNISDVNQQLNEKRERSRELREKLGKSTATSVSIGELNELRISVGRMERKQVELKERIATTEEKLGATKQRLALAQEKLSTGMNIDELNARIEAQRKLESTYASIDGKKSTEERTLALQERSLLKLLDVPCGDAFPTCKYIKDSHNDKQGIEAQRSLVERLRVELGETLALLSFVRGEDLERRLVSAQKMHNAHRMAQDALLNYERELTFLREQAAQNGEILEVNLNRLKEMESNVDEKQQEYIDGLRASLGTLDNEVRALDAFLLKLHQTKGSLEFTLANTVREESEHNARLMEYKIYELVANAFSKKGIPSKVLRNQLPIVNEEIAGILSGIVNFGVKLELDEDANTLEIYMFEGNSKRLLEMCSGMEKVISSLAIKVALRNISTLPKFDTLVLDEGFSDLDESGVEACSRLLRSLRRYYKCVLMVTHIETLKDVVDAVIEVHRKDGFTRVQHG